MSDRRTSTGAQTFRGLIIVGCAFSLGKAFGPYAEAVPDQTVQYVTLAIFLASAYGMALIFTSPVALEFAAHLDAQMARFRGDGDD